MSDLESTSSRYPSAAESIAALRARVEAANAAGNAATAAAVARNEEIIAANKQDVRDINAEVANGQKPDVDLLRVMFPEQYS